LREYRFSLDDKDYTDFNIRHTLYSPHAKLLMSRFCWVFLGLILIQLIFGLIGSKDLIEILASIITFAILSFSLWFIFSKGFLSIVIKFLVKFGKRAGKLPYAKNTCLQFHDDHILDIGDDMETKIAYTKIEHIFVSPTATYIYFSVAQAVLVPNHVFAETEDHTSLLQFLEEKTGKTAQHWAR